LTRSAQSQTAEANAETGAYHALFSEPLECYGSRRFQRGVALAPVSTGTHRVRWGL